jgi:hypothetical protein
MITTCECYCSQLDNKYYLTTVIETKLRDWFIGRIKTHSSMLERNQSRDSFMLAYEFLLFFQKAEENLKSEIEN